MMENKLCEFFRRNFMYLMLVSKMFFVLVVEKLYSKYIFILEMKEVVLI